MISIKNTAEKFFDACETGKGWAVSQGYPSPSGRTNCPSR